MLDIQRLIKALELYLELADGSTLNVDDWPLALENSP